MNYINFINTMYYKVSEQIRPDEKVEIHETKKNNGVIRKGLMFTQKDVIICPTIYLEEFYEQFLQGESISSLVNKIYSLYEEVKIKQSFPYKDILKLSDLEENIAYKLIHYESNKELLEDVPHIRFLDLAVVFYALVDEKSEFGFVSLLIRNINLKDWGITEKQLLEIAERNTEKLLPAQLIGLSSFMYVLTNHIGVFGASVILYEGICRRIERIVRGSFYIIPCSIHEMLIIPESFGAEKEYLEMMVKEVNETEIDEEEILSDRVYFYDAEKRYLS